MDASELDTRSARRGTRPAGGRSILAMGLAAVIGLSACGGSSHTESDSTSAAAATPSTQTAAPAATVTGATTSSNGADTSTSAATGSGSTGTAGTSASSATAAPAGTSTSASTTTAAAKSQKRTSTADPSKKKQPGKGRTSKAPTTGTVTTIAANAAAPAYSGPSPIGCLEAAGLNRARPGIEEGAWEANYGVTSEGDTNALVLLSGPYEDDGEATSYAQSLQSVELSASGGRWVASASQMIHLQAQVNAAAACMAGSGAS